MSGAESCSQIQHCRAFESCNRLQQLGFAHHQAVANREACERFGIAYRTANQAVYVCKAFESSTRVEHLSWKHHQVVANRDDAGELLPKVEAVIRDDPEALAMFRDAMKHQGQRSDLSDNVREVESTDSCGNSRAYSIARVQKECDPETVAAVMSGKMTPHAALIKDEP